MNRILTGKNKGITLATVYKIACGFNMTLNEFMSDIFQSEEIEVE